MTSVEEGIHPRPTDGALGGGGGLSPSVLIVDDDRTLQGLIGDFLQQHGLRVYCASAGAEVDALLAIRPVDVVVLDVMLRGEDGLSICRRLAARTHGRPAILILSAAADTTDRIVGLELGADDYVSKPANPRELLARIRALRRRFAAPAYSAAAPDPNDDGGYEFSGWTLSVWTHELKTPDGETVPLTSSDFALLRAFLEHPRRVLTRDHLLNLVRGRESFSFDRAVDVQVSRLRRKLIAADPRDGDLVRTVRNEGYMFVAAVRKT